MCASMDDNGSFFYHLILFIGTLHCLAMTLFFVRVVVAAAAAVAENSRCFTLIFHSVHLCVSGYGGCLCCCLCC